MMVKKLFFFLVITIFVNSFLPVFAGEDENNLCKDRCEANEMKKETGYATTDGTCKDKFVLVESSCCCEPK